MPREAHAHGGEGAGEAPPLSPQQAGGVRHSTATPAQDLTFGGLLLATARPRSLAGRMATSELCSFWRNVGLRSREWLSWIRSHIVLIHFTNIP